MSFDEVSFPLKITASASGGPLFSTEIVVLDGGYERRNQNWSQARRRYDARGTVKTPSDATMLMAFFMARAGRARGFRLKDWTDYTSSADGISAASWNDQNIGTGNGNTATFQLMKNYGSGSVVHSRIIRKPVSGSVKIGVNGAEMTSGWSVDATTGLVTFASPPASGHTVTAGFSFDVPVRFDTDALAVLVADDKSSRTEIPIVELRV